MESPSLSVEQAVRDRYAAAAQSREEDLCCPIDYDGALLAVIPAEIIERDYGCGDPSRWARPGDTVLDLGAGGGKICFMAAQVVGATGRVLGVDMNADNHRYERGARTAVCGRTFRMLTADPYQPHFVALAPAQEIPVAEQALFPCDGDILRHPRETKGSRVIVPTENTPGCC